MRHNFSEMFLRFSFQNPPKRSISRVISLDVTISRRLSRAMTGEIGGSGMQIRAGIWVDQSFYSIGPYSWRNICVLEKTTLPTSAVTPRHSHTHTTYKMACIASSFTGSVAAPTASTFLLRAREHPGGRGRARAVPSPAFFLRRHPATFRDRVLSSPSYLERV